MTKEFNCYRLIFSRVFVNDFSKIYLIHLRPKIKGNEETQFHRYRYTKVHSCKACKPIQATRWIFLSNSTECIEWITASPRRNNRHELPFSRWILPRNKAFAIHSLSFFSLPLLSLPLSILDRVGSTDVFVRPGENSQPTTKGTLPFSRDLHKISILFDVREKYRRVTNTHARISPSPPSSWMNLRLATIFLPVETGSSRFNERHHKGEKSLFSRLYPISRLHPSLHAPSAPQPPLSRLRIGPLSIAAVLLLNLPQIRLSTLSFYIVFDASFFSTLFPTVDILSLDS